MFVGPVAGFPSKSSAAWTFVAEFPSLKLSADLEQDFPRCVSLDLGEESSSAFVGLVELSLSIFYLKFWKSFIVNCRKDVFGIKSLMLRSNYSFYP